MDVIELDNIGEEGREEGRDQEGREERDREDTSFSENTKDNYDNTRSRINSESATQSETNTERGNSDSTDSERRVQDQLDKRAKQRYDTVRVLGSMTDIKFSTTHGENSMELINYVSDAKYSEKGNLTALKIIKIFSRR